MLLYLLLVKCLFIYPLHILLQKLSQLVLLHCFPEVPAHICTYDECPAILLFGKRLNGDQKYQLVKLPTYQLPVLIYSRQHSEPWTDNQDIKIFEGASIAQKRRIK